VGRWRLFGLTRCSGRWVVGPASSLAPRHCSSPVAGGLGGAPLGSDVALAGEVDALFGVGWRGGRSVKSFGGFVETSRRRLEHP